VESTTFDSAVETTADSIRIAGATRGELGGFLDVTVTATDESLPTGSNGCEPAVVDAVLTLSPGETLAAMVPGEACTTFFGDALTVNAAIGQKDLAYAGTAHRDAKLVGDGLIAASNGWLGGQASFLASVRWR